MGSSFMFDTLNLGRSTVYIKGSQVFQFPNTTLFLFLKIISSGFSQFPRVLISESPAVYKGLTVYETPNRVPSLKCACYIVLDQSIHLLWRFVIEFNIRKMCLFLYFNSLRPSHHLSVMLGRFVLGWTSNKHLKYLAQGLNAVLRCGCNSSISSQTLYNWAIASQENAIIKP